ncbi:MAG: hypothetical protein ABIP61_09455 [Burkholderiaceae bacterium]
MESPVTAENLSCSYSSTAFSNPPSFSAETAYIVGGIYGNVEALRRVLQMKDQEEQRHGTAVKLIFNGDYNWLNCDAESFIEINQIVLRHFATRGNVETELGDSSSGNGCGCNYPSNIDSSLIEQSNAIMKRMQILASQFQDITDRLATLPMFCSVTVGNKKIGVLHGDADSLAGWGFSYEAMPSPSRDERFSDAEKFIATSFRNADVSAFASTHTGLPFLQDFMVDDTRRVIINNGAAGLPNFRGTTFGLLSRVSSRPEPPHEIIYGTTLEGVRFDALPIRYESGVWIKRFLRNWPPGSVAHESYFDRITQGPDHSIENAMRFGRES